eukprot:5671655-Amphidinium_carterae.1
MFFRDIPAMLCEKGCKWQLTFSASGNSLYNSRAVKLPNLLMRLCMPHNVIGTCGVLTCSQPA